MSNAVHDRQLQQEFNWKGMLLEFKIFQRKSGNANKEPPAKHNAFFDIMQKVQCQSTIRRNVAKCMAQHSKYVRCQLQDQHNDTPIPETTKLVPLQATKWAEDK